jgi:hypothetical protein
MRLPSSLFSSRSLAIVPLPLPVVDARVHAASNCSRRGVGGAVRAHPPVVVAPAPSLCCPCPRCSLFPPHEQLLVAAVGGAVVVVLIVPSPSWLSYGGGAGSSLSSLPHPLSLPLPFPFSLSSSTIRPVVVVITVPSLPPAFTPEATAAGVTRAVVVPHNPHLRFVVVCPRTPVHPASSCSQRRRGMLGRAGRPSPSLLRSLSLSCTFPVPIVPGLVLPVSTLRAVACSGSGGSGIPWAFPVSR